MKDMLDLIWEILSLCVHRPTLAMMARCTLNEIASDARPNRRAENAIYEHVRRKAAQRGGRRLVFPQTSSIRLMAAAIAKKYKIQFDENIMKKKQAILDWLDGHWDDVGSSFLMMLDCENKN
jgi:hypothetical protein